MNSDYRSHQSYTARFDYCFAGVAALVIVYNGAGAVRNAVWDALTGYQVPTRPGDIDVVYFDAGDISQERDDAP